MKSSLQNKNHEQCNTQSADTESTEKCPPFLAITIQSEVQPVVPNGLIRERTIQNAMRTSGSTFQCFRLPRENALRLNSSGSVWFALWPPAAPL